MAGQSKIMGDGFRVVHILGQINWRRGRSKVRNDHRVAVHFFKFIKILEKIDVNRDLELDYCLIAGMTTKGI